MAMLNRDEVEEGAPPGGLEPVEPPPHRRVVDPEQRRGGDEPADAGDREQVPQVVGAHLVRLGPGAHAPSVGRRRGRLRH